MLYNIYTFIIIYGESGSITVLFERCSYTRWYSTHQYSCLRALQIKIINNSYLGVPYFTISCTSREIDGSLSKNIVVTTQICKKRGIDYCTFFNRALNLLVIHSEQKMKLEFISTCNMSIHNHAKKKSRCRASQLMVFTHNFTCSATKYANSHNDIILENSICW